MKLYIANLSKQNHEFLYRRKIDDGLRKQEIRAGRQILVAEGDLAQDEIDHIVKHHERMGLRRYEELPSLKEYVGLCYRIDQPMPVDGYLETYEHNDDVLTKTGQERLETAAKAISQEMHMDERAAVPLKRTAIEIVEENDKDQPRIAQGIEVVEKGVEPRNQNKNKRA